MQQKKLHIFFVFKFIRYIFVQNLKLNHYEIRIEECKIL
jgi:hypothetical protein